GVLMSPNSRIQLSVSLTKQSRKLLSGSNQLSLLIGVAVAAFALVSGIGLNTGVSSRGAAAGVVRVNAVVQSNSDADLLAKVSQRILAVTRTHPSNVAWPPVIRLENENDLNAYATIEADRQKDGKWKPRVDSSGRYIPYV